MQNHRTIKQLGILAAIFLSILVFVVVVFWRNGPPRDSTLAQQFEVNRIVYEELRDMLREDVQRHNISQIAKWGLRKQGQGVSCSPEEVGLPNERYEKYLALMEKAGIGVCIQTESDYRFTVAGSGFASSGYRIAITWNTNSPSPIIKSLDDFHKKSSQWEQAYRPLKEGWYLWIIW